MKHFVLSLLTCSLSMTVIALLFRLICRRLGNRYAARWRYGVWLVVLLGFLLLALHSLLVAVAPNVWVLYLAQILCGLGNLLLFSILAAMAIRYIPQENKSTAMGLFQALYGIGMTIGPLLLSNMVAAWNYRTAYLVFGAIAVVSLILAAVTLPMLAHRMEGKRAQ